ncbi:MAG: bifunctional phosphoribosylaminoimidazolecarboxamide formyltransferase/IMP cyclohydrolase [Phycisphaerales bacterium]|nr:bifunctional phosphoribosylaminoimidazolecarboxamide formyltransferase/IMP cyclohydrolase [Phycisphaerales bacterium]
MPQTVRIQRALISVSDKTGLDSFARALVKEFNIQLISTGGTARYLRDLGLEVTDVSQVTGFPEMMDGRVKTLHPKIHGALLARRDNPEHRQAMQQHDIAPIDLVCINLYPFEPTIRRENVTLDEAIENIDIGGPSMIRSAAKNHDFLTVVTNPVQYDEVLIDLRKNSGSSSSDLRVKLAQRAFAHTSHYDSMIANYLASAARLDSGSLVIHLHKHMDLRYGENPHQRAALMVDRRPNEASVAYATQLHGKELSYINLLDADAALNAVKELSAPTVCIVKHATPCGYASADDLPTAFGKAFEGDPLAAFGGIVALNQPVDLATAQAITSIDKLLEVIVAPSYQPEALNLLRNRWKNVRLLEVGPVGLIADGDPNEVMMHKITGGFLLQERDRRGFDPATIRVVSKRQPTAQQLHDLKIAWLACKHVKSNAITIGRDGMIVGVGGGQVDRVGACHIAIAKAGQRAHGAVAASDAFFPFPDGPQALLDAGISAIIHPGGSVRDQDSINIVDQHDAVMVVTGERHFRH